MAPPLVMAASRAPRLPETTPLTWSRCRWALALPRRVENPSDSISTTSSNSRRVRLRYGQARRASSQRDSSETLPVAAVATTCWARMSRGFSGTMTRSSSPARAEGLAGHLDGELPVPPVADVHDGAVGGAGLVAPARADQQTRDVLDRPLGGGEADALPPVAGQGIEPLERQRKVGSPLVARHRVDLVDDDRPGGPQEGAAALRGQEDVERLRRRDQDVGGPADHQVALGGRRVAGADRHPDLRERRTLVGCEPADGGERLGEVLVDVVAESLERGDVDDGRLLLQRAVHGRGHERVDRPEEGGERLAGPGGAGDQGVPPPRDRLPPGGLRGRGRLEGLGEPARDERVEGRLCHSAKLPPVCRLRGSDTGDNERNATFPRACVHGCDAPAAPGRAGGRSLDDGGVREATEAHEPGQGLLAPGPGRRRLHEGRPPRLLLQRGGAPPRPRGPAAAHAQTHARRYRRQLFLRAAAAAG